MRCYARKGAYVFESTKDKHQSNFALSLNEDFIPAIRQNILALKAYIVRVHAAGDFYDEVYTDKWYEIAASLPDVAFFAYTRSWRSSTCSSELIAAVKRLGELPNFRMWLSCDQMTGRPPLWKHSPAAYMSTGDSDLPHYPVELVFRDKPETHMRRAKPSGALVCPYEQGLEAAKVKCTSCRLCFDPSRSVLRDFDRAMATMVAAEQQVESEFFDDFYPQTDPQGRQLVSIQC